MASTKECLDFVLERLSVLNDVTYRAMMGEYVVYYRDKVIGGIYDNRFLVKYTQAGAKTIPNAKLVEPYKGAKKMLLINNVENGEQLENLIKATYEALPAPKKARGTRP